MTPKSQDVFLIFEAISEMSKESRSLVVRGLIIGYGCRLHWLPSWHQIPKHLHENLDQDHLNTLQVFNL
jgi:hypothetical protein